MQFRNTSSVLCKPIYLFYSLFHNSLSPIIKLIPNRLLRLNIKMTDEIFLDYVTSQFNWYEK